MLENIFLNWGQSMKNKQGFFCKYRGYNIYNFYSSYIVTNPNGLTIGEALTILSCEYIIDNDIAQGGI